MGLLDTLLTTLRRIDAERAPERYAPDMLIQARLETRHPGEDYHWDGNRRGGDPANPFIVFQFTLEGWGIYEDAGTPHRMLPGEAFAAVVPGAHRYYMPAHAPTPWTFFWIIVRHRYVVERIAARQREMGNAVWTLGEEGALLSRAVTLFAGRFADRWDEEAALFDFLLAFERVAEPRMQGENAAAIREKMLADGRRFVEARLSEPFGVAEMAREWGMERSRFSHRFKAVTGQSPAQFITRVRLEEAARRLVRSEDTLARVAADTGFADANHLCKVFRRHFRLSPGAYRRQIQ